MITPIIVPMTVEVSETSVPMGVATSNVNVPMTIGTAYKGGSADFPPGGYAGDLLAKRTDADNDVEWITPANNVEQDNTRPITAAAVYTEVGNINALLATI